MSTNSNFKSLIIVTLLSGCTSLSTSVDNVQAGNDLAPEATAAEAAISFWDLPYLEEAFIDLTPADRKDGLPVGELVVNGDNKALILQLAQELADEKQGKYDSLLISHQGKLIFESYYLRGRVNLPHWQGSATKSYVSLVVGRAMQLGYLTMADLDKPLVSFLKDLDPTKFVGGVEKITLHKAMTMRSGLRFSEELMEEFRGNPGQFKGLDQIQAFLELSAPVTSESQIYKYQSPDPIMVIQVLDAVVPGSAKEFIKNEFLNKLGINVYSWRNDLSGLPSGDEGLSITSRDMLKLGTLAISKGQWNGEQLISADYLAKATSRITKPAEDWQPDSFHYGYFWYQTEMKVGDKSYDVNIAWGGGGQHIITLEELDLIVVITGHDREDTIFTQVSKKIIPAFVEDEFSVLGSPYFGQKPPGLTPEVFAPGFVSINGRYEGAISFSPDLDEMYFTANDKNENPAIYFSKLKSNKWTPIEKAAFTNGIKDKEIHPFVSPDGKRIYFSAFRSDLSDTVIWYVNRLENSWSNAVQLDLPVNDDLVFFPIQAKNGDLYYFNLSKMKTYYAANTNGAFPEAKELEIEPGFHHVFISPSQDYLVLNGRSREDEGRKDNDLYISFKEQDGTWSKPINLGDAVNTNVDEKGPGITPDGKYLFFGRDEADGKANIYWVSTEIITGLKTAYFKQ